jgi:uncharacterized membrane protein HdeD (DUF308 family)
MKIRDASMDKFIKLFWWALLLRGVLEIVFGALVIFRPGLTLEVLILFFGAYALVDAVISAAAAQVQHEHDSTWCFFPG